MDINSRKITLNALVQILGRGVVIFFSLLATSILTRGFGKINYGIFSLVSSMAVIFYSISDWGTNLIAVREASKSEENTSLILGQMFWLRTFLALVATLLFLLFVNFNPFFAGFKKEAFLCFWLIPLLSLKTTSHIVFQSRLKYHLITLGEVLSTLAFLVILVFAGNNFSLNLVFIFLVISSSLSTFFMILLVFKETKIIFKINFAFMKRFIKEAFPLGLLMVVFNLYNRADSFILQAISGNAKTGIFLLAFKVHDNLILGAAYLMNAFFPLISQLGSVNLNKKKMNEVLQKAFDILLVISIPMIIFVFFLSPWIIRLLGGKEFGESSLALRIMIFATGFGYFNHFTGYTILALGKQKASLLFGFIALVVNVVLNLLLVGRYSFVATSFIKVITEAVIFILSIFYLKLRLGYSFSIFSFAKSVKKILINKERFFENENF